MNQELESWKLIRKLLFILIMKIVIKSKRPIEVLPHGLRIFLQIIENTYFCLYRKEDLEYFREILVGIINELSKEIKTINSVNKKETLF